MVLQTHALVPKSFTAQTQQMPTSSFQHPMPISLGIKMTLPTHHNDRMRHAPHIYDHTTTNP